MRILPSPFHAAPPRATTERPPLALVGPHLLLPDSRNGVQAKRRPLKNPGSAGENRSGTFKILYVLQGPVQWLAESPRFKRLRWLGWPYFPAHPRGNSGVLLLSVPISSDISPVLFSRERASCMRQSGKPNEKQRGKSGDGSLAVSLTHTLSVPVRHCTRCRCR
jgi:hypothetical protein